MMHAFKKHIGESREQRKLWPNELQDQGQPQGCAICAITHPLSLLKQDPLALIVWAPKACTFHTTFGAQTYEITTAQDAVSFPCLI